MGFTLIELLVVMAIIGILAGLLLPAFARGKAAARTTECRNNLRTMGLALRMYLDEHHHFPSTMGAGVLGYGDKYGWLMMNDWTEKLVPHVGVLSDHFVSREATMRTLRCPQRVSNQDGRRGEGQYAYNAAGTGPMHDPLNLGLGGSAEGGYGDSRTYRPTAESRVRAPSDMIAVGDIQPGQTLGRMFGTNSRFVPAGTNRWGWPGNSHANRANLLFVDGHVETGRTEAWVAATDAARRRWNADHEPHPETWPRSPTSDSSRSGN
ncbi:MAG: DUF1559 domain-containing protein [Verrucomicrobiales bacterium]|nr:DUF1559 domain-containing protein [Verrucomicrobiales bacterium]